jgi:hypothetical protein
MHYSVVSTKTKRFGVASGWQAGDPKILPCTTNLLNQSRLKNLVRLIRLLCWQLYITASYAQVSYEYLKDLKGNDDPESRRGRTFDDENIIFYGLT